MSESTELWLDVPGYEGKYEVSNLGRVLRLQHIRTKVINWKFHSIKVTEKILTPFLSSGYFGITLINDNGSKSFPVHRLVAMAFIRQPKTIERLVINHIDGVKTNNHVSNLEWVTYKQNSTHASLIGLSKHDYPKITVEQYKKERGIECN